MKKILFITQGLGRDMATKMHLEYPYGRTSSIEWAFTSIHNLPKEHLKQYISGYNMVYNLLVGSNICDTQVPDLPLIGNIDTETLLGAAQVNSPYIIWEEGLNSLKMGLHSIFKHAITLYYQKTSDPQFDYMRIKADFQNIIYNRSSYNTPKQLFKSEKLLTYQEKEQYSLHFQECSSLSKADKIALQLNIHEEYIASFVDKKECAPAYYSMINRKLRKVIHLDDWIQASFQWSE